MKFAWDAHKNQSNIRKHGFSFADAMNDNALNEPSETDWNRIDAITDDQIDTSDIPPLTEDFFQRAKVRKPNVKVPVTVEVDADVLAWFQAQGENYDQCISAALRIYAEAHRAAQH